MFELSTAWWELPLRVSIVYVALLVLVRVSGKRTVGQFTPFDLLVVMLLSEAVSAGLNGDEKSITGGLLAASTLVGLHVIVAALVSRNEKLQKLVEGSPVLIGRNGKFYQSVLRKCYVSQHDIERALRETDCNQEDMKYAFLEADGEISILKESSAET